MLQKYDSKTTRSRKGGLVKGWPHNPATGEDTATSSSLAWGRTCWSPSFPWQVAGGSRLFHHASTPPSAVCWEGGVLASVLRGVFGQLSIAPSCSGAGG